MWGVRRQLAGSQLPRIRDQAPEAYEVGSEIQFRLRSALLTSFWSHSYRTYTVVHDFRIHYVSKRLDPCEVRRLFRSIKGGINGHSGRNFSGRWRNDLGLSCVPPGERQFQHTGDVRDPRPLDRKVFSGDSDGISFSFDEVELEFPSMDKLVRKIRQDFGENEEEMSRLTRIKQIQLTPRQAAFGMAVPVVLEMRETCLLCGGRGEVWQQLCSVCLGIGDHLLPHEVRLKIPPGVSHGTRLRFNVAPSYVAEMRVEVQIVVS